MAVKFCPNVKQDLPFLIVLFVILFLLPHIALSLPNFPEEPLENWMGADKLGDDASIILWTMFWTLIPFLTVVIGLLRVLYDRSFSPLLPLEALVISLTYLPRLRLSLVLGLAALSLLLLATEGLNRLGDYGRRPGKKPGLLAEAADNDKFLAVVFAWSAGYLTALCVAACFRAVFELPMTFFALLPTALVLPFLPLTALEDPPLTRGGLVGVGLLWALSALLAMTPLMSPSVAVEVFLPWHLGFLSLGFALLLLMEGLIWLGRRVKRRRRRAGQRPKPHRTGGGPG